jgi:DNA mismatch repair protein MutS2
VGVPRSVTDADRLAQDLQLVTEPAPEPTQSAVRKSATDLEWPLLLDRVAANCSTPMAAARVRLLSPEPDLERARFRMTLVQQTLSLAEAGESLPAARLTDQQPLFERLRRGGAATGQQLLCLAELLRLAGALRRFATTQRERHPELASVLASDPELDELHASLERALEPDGSIASAASAELRKARHRVDETRHELLAQLRQLMERYSALLRDQYYAEREGRYVLPVRADAHLRVPGIVLGASGSGATLYLEPQELVPLGNELRVAQAAVQREEARILAELSSWAGQTLPALEHAYDCCIEADLLCAIARWASEVDAQPLCIEAQPVLDLKAMRHPLLVGLAAPVVANDLRLDHGTALIISGPNAGGKTVTLKCLGLMAWMARSGIPLPVATGSRVGWFEPVLTDVGDEQSLLTWLG